MPGRKLSRSMVFCFACGLAFAATPARAADPVFLTAANEVIKGAGRVVDELAQGAHRALDDVSRATGNAVDRSSGRSLTDEQRRSITAARSRNRKLVVSRVEALQKLESLRRWQASIPRTEREEAIIRRHNERLRKLQKEAAKRAREQQNQN